MAFFEDNLLSVQGGLTHHGVQVTADEDLSPTLENAVVALWLQYLLQTARFFQVLHLSLLLSFLPGGLAVNEAPHFGKIRTGT